MSDKNVGKKCTIGLSTQLYEIEKYSRLHGGKYLVRAFEVRDNELYFGWVEAANVHIKEVWL